MFGKMENVYGESKVLFGGKIHHHIFWHNGEGICQHVRIYINIFYKCDKNTDVVATACVEIKEV